MPAPPPPTDTYRSGPFRRPFRRAGRLLGGVGATLGHSVVWAVGLPFHRGPERSLAWRVRCFRGWGRALCRIGALHIEVVGEPPREPCVLVTNHVGYADILVLAAVLEGPAFVSMHEIRTWPLIGFMAARMGTIFIDRRDKRAIPVVNAAIGAALERGQVVVLFAEGGNSDGRAVRPFRPPLLDPAARLGAPCTWGTLHYRVLPGDPPASRSVCWHEETIWRQAVRFLALERIHARVAFGGDSLRCADRKQLAADLHARVLSRFQPIE
ncbi:MAG: lysophospholipid acyltransferase family protein [Planctomycetota bacterium]|nr:lysophospholipid acyltransferase family protein [Planctomycetota bacterium]